MCVCVTLSSVTILFITLRRNNFYGNIFRSVHAAEGWERVAGAKGWWKRSLRVRYRMRLGATVFQKFPCGSLTLSTGDRACYQTVTRVARCQERGYIRRHDHDQDTPSLARHRGRYSRSRKKFFFPEGK